MNDASVRCDCPSSLENLQAREFEGYWLLLQLMLLFSSLQVCTQGHKTEASAHVCGHTNHFSNIPILTSEALQLHSR